VSELILLYAVIGAIIMIAYCLKHGPENEMCPKTILNAALAGVGWPLYLTARAVWTLL
jgi:hypothetical protein